MSRVLVLGDSWGCGEWNIGPDNKLELAHPGLTEYLSSEYAVTNLSRAGVGNWQNIFALKNYLNFRVNPDETSIILVIQTDSFRPWMIDKFQIDYDSIVLQSNSLIEFYRSMVELFYIKLNFLAEQYNTKVHMIGGLTDLDFESLSLYNNLMPCCESWTKLIDKEHVVSQIPLMLDSRLLVKVKSLNKLNLVDEVIAYSDQNFLKAQKLMETDFFGPAYGDFHPSRKAHKILADHIITYLDNIKQ